MVISNIGASKDAINRIYYFLMIYLAVKSAGAELLYALDLKKTILVFYVKNCVV